MLAVSEREDDFIIEIYGDLSQFNPELETDRLLGNAILTPKNVDMRKINEKAIQHLPGNIKEYKSINTVCDLRHACHYTEEYLQSLKINNFPEHNLQLKIGAPIMVLRNIDPLNGICNGTKGIITQLWPHLIEMETKDFNGIKKKVLIHRLSLIPSDPQIPIRFKRRQFPVSLCFAMTINKTEWDCIYRSLFLVMDKCTLL